MLQQHIGGTAAATSYHPHSDDLLCLASGNITDACTAHNGMPLLLQDRLNSNYAELSGAFKTSLEGLARTVQDLHSIIK